MSIVSVILGTVFIAIGLFIIICALVGFYQFKYILSRMHAAALIDTLGIFFVALGLVILNGFVMEDGSVNIGTIKMIMVVLFLWLSSPLSSHLISKLIYLTDDKTDEMDSDDIAIDGDRKKRKEGKRNE